MAGINLFSLYAGNTSSIYNTIYNSNMLKNTSAASSSSKFYGNYGTYSTYGKNISSTSEEAQDYLSGLKQYGSQLKAAADTITSRFPPLFEQLSATLSNTEALSVTEVNQVGASKNKSLQVDIDQVATTQKNQGNAMVAADKTDLAGYNQFSIETGGKTYDFGVTIAAGDTNQKAQQRIAEAINKRNIGVTASVAYDEKTKESSLVLESKETGEKNAFNVTQASGGLLMDMGINNTTQLAQDAEFSVDGGVTRTSASNKVNLGNGVTAELKQATDKSVKVDLTKDVNKIVNAVYDLVNNYNGLMETAQDFKSTGARSLEDQLKSAYRSSSYSLERAGITADKNGYLKIDTDKLKKAAEDGTLESALGANSNSTSYGFANRVKQTARSADSSPTTFLGKAEDTANTNTNSAYASNSSYFTNNNGRSNSYYNYMLNKLTGAGLLFEALF
jgi:flagellar capping protein FliD